MLSLIVSATFKFVIYVNIFLHLEHDIRGSPNHCFFEENNVGWKFKCSLILIISFWHLIIDMQCMFLIM